MLTVELKKKMNGNWLPYTSHCALVRLARFHVTTQPVTRLTLAAAVEHAQGVTIEHVKASC